ncbi:MAG: pyridoxal-5'-phosphate-dependent protein [Magnetovibrio sp.]|nr:pyridoxal-5'-phosphate-dependent protein [Magnetovibrio sp.]
MEVSYRDITSAAKRLTGLAVETPLLESSLLNKMIGVRVLLKAEPLQRTGSFKFRGAYNAISVRNTIKKVNGVVAYSSGNHAQGVAAAAAMIGLPATIIMPEDAPRLKIDNTRAYEAKIITYNRFIENREEIGQTIAYKRNLTLIKPYDDPLVIAGQGTVGREIILQSQKLSAQIDSVYVPCGGGGLVAGVGLALAKRSPSTEVFSVEPKNFDDTRLSLLQGERVWNKPKGYSICDSLLAEVPGELTFSINSKILTGGVFVSDKDTRLAMKNIFQYYKLIAEPGGAVAFAALMKNKERHQGKTVVVVCSGGNVDANLFAEALS